MCYYRLFIFLGCGHSTFSARPLRFCPNAQSNIVANTKRRKRSLDAASRSSSATTKIDEAGETIIPSGDQVRLETQGTTKTSHKIKKPLPRSSSPAIDDFKPCADGRAHPFNRIRLERLCAICEYDRDQRLQALESSTDEIRFEPARWRWKYQGTKGPRAGRGDESGVRKEGKRASGLWGMGTAVEGWWK
ncbi:hypothetical protein IAQ61_004347 [Plenodomus lingam]|uniref:uncharacterized protein n=1 Tax=Leptosphaeria maculans TaxID=5022 RepID=UPI00332A0B76|nr:hypothetical protein IAQ61_004347 [Plenodomus lingam]